MARTQVLRPVAAILDSTLWNVKGALHGSHWKDLIGTSFQPMALVKGNQEEKAPFRNWTPATIDPFFSGLPKVEL